MLARESRLKLAPCSCAPPAFELVPLSCMNSWTCVPNTSSLSMSRSQRRTCVRRVEGKVSVLTEDSNIVMVDCRTSSRGRKLHNNFEEASSLMMPRRATLTRHFTASSSATGGNPPGVEAALSAEMRCVIVASMVSDTPAPPCKTGHHLSSRRTRFCPRPPDPLPLSACAAACSASSRLTARNLRVVTQSGQLQKTYQHKFMKSLHAKSLRARATT